MWITPKKPYNTPYFVIDIAIFIYICDNNTMRLLKDTKEDLIYLLNEYRTMREDYIERTKDMENIRDTLVQFFNDNKIKEFLHNGKKFFIYDIVWYKYPSQCKKHKGVKQIPAQYFKMLDKKEKRSTPFRTRYNAKKYL